MTISYVAEVRSLLTLRSLETNLTEAYKLKPQANWYQRLAWWVLQTTGALARHAETVEFIRHPVISERHLPDAIRHAVADARRDNRAPAELIIGSGDYAEMVHTAGPETMLSFTAANGPPRFMGLQVKVVPWMKGWVVL